MSIEWIVDHLAVVMFFALILGMFMGFPVALTLGGIGVVFGFIGIGLDEFRLARFATIPSRIYGSAVISQVLMAIPMFIFMGVVLERSRIAEDLLKTLQILLRRVPGGLAMSVALLGTIMAATTGIVGASVIMLTLMALPTMLERNYSHELATGTIAASGTLGILIPPSIMLVILGDLVQVPIGTLFAAAVFPGLLLSILYLVYIWVFAHIRPSAAPPLPDDLGPETRGELMLLVLKSIVPPAFLIFAVLGSIFLGLATPTEASGVGCAGALLLAALNRSLNMTMLKGVIESAGTTNALVFFIILGATVFSVVFRYLGGDAIVKEILLAAGLDTGWEILIFLMVLVFFLGFFFDFIEISLIVIPIFYPIIKALNFGDHVTPPFAFMPWVTILIAVNLQTSFLTPPFGFSLFYMKGVVPPEVKMVEIYRGIIPFVILQLSTVGLVMAFPEIALWLPRVTGFLE
ncbi:MAG: TRAP transporter large permease subunit [Geminicoccaceae bacterium]|nr:TRAP transporter large permease subunit [Geminicoccaceae bacterium]